MKSNALPNIETWIKEKDHNMKLRIYVLIALLACIAFLPTVASAKPLESSVTISSGGVVIHNSTGSYSYIISVSGSNYQMKYGHTGQILFQSTNSSRVFSNVVGNCSVGSSIDVESGRYSVTASWTLLGINDISLNFESGSILVAANNLNAPVLRLNGVNNCVISGITIDGNAANQVHTGGGMPEVPEDGISINPVSSNNYVEGANITNCGLVGFRITDGASANNGITNSFITLCGWNGITFGLYTSNSYAENVEVAYCGDVGISTYGTHSRITNNYVHDINGKLGYNNAHWGIGVEGGSTNYIFGNLIDNTDTGISIGSSGYSACNNNTISRNDISNNVLCGISVYASSHNVIEDNQITRAGSSTINGIGMWFGSATFNLISRNYVSQATYCGIMLTSASDNNTLSLNNVFDNGVMGMDISGTRNYISQNQLFDDRSGNSRTQYYGIIMDSKANNNVLAKNNLYNNIGHQILDFNVPQNSFMNNTGYNPSGYIATPISGNTAYLVDSIVYGTTGNSTWISGLVYTNSGSPKVLNISGGTVSAIVQNGVTLFTATDCTLTLQPGDTLRVSFSAAPTINVSGQ
jgi:parallel beta-helix repeat protein